MGFENVFFELSLGAREKSSRGVRALVTQDWKVIISKKQKKGFTGKEEEKKFTPLFCECAGMKRKEPITLQQKKIHERKKR